MKIFKIIESKYGIKMVQFIFFVFGVIKASIYGLKKVDLIKFLEDRGERIPFSVRILMPKHIRKNCKYGAGKSITFFTDLNNLEFMVVYKRRVILNNMSYVGTSGLDIYLKHNSDMLWQKCFSPTTKIQMELKDTLELKDGVKRITIFLPPYAQVAKLILLNSNKGHIWKDYTCKKAVAVYGSSISQGCAASRPGLSYTNLLAQKLDLEVSNYGFSEGARGEKRVIEYIISNKNYKWILIEYDHNSNLEEFSQRHIEIYKIIRNITDVPILFLSRISGGISNTEQDNDKRIKVIKETMKYVNKVGDKKVFFINGHNLISKNNDRKNYLEDDRHPNDLGMKLIADAIENIVNERVS